MSAPSDVDRCLRAMTNDGGLRLVAVALRETVRGATSIQEVGSPLAEELAALMVGTILLRETTSPTRRVQIALRDSSGGKLIADSLPDGKTRGLVNPGNDPRVVGRGRRMEVTYSQGNGALHKGIVEIADDTEIEAAMMTYLQESEQILSSMSIATTPSAGSEAGRATAVGFVVQLLPELERSLLETMTERLAKLRDVNDLRNAGDEGLPTATELVARIFDGLEYTILADSPVCFGCNCSKDRFLAGLSTLGSDEVSSMIEAGEALELRCEACGRDYEITVDELRAL